MTFIDQSCQGKEQNIFWHLASFLIADYMLICDRQSLQIKFNRSDMEKHFSQARGVLLEHENNLKLKKKFLCKILCISEGEFSDIRSTFCVFDADGDGEISVRDLGMVLKLLGANPSKGQTKNMIAELDADRSGTVTFKEFLLAQVEKKQSNMTEEQDIRNAFRCIDDNDDGFITTHELQRTFEIFGAPITWDEAKSMIKEHDMDGDGRIDFDEFYTAIKNTSLNDESSYLKENGSELDITKQ